MIVLEVLLIIFFATALIITIIVYQSKIMVYLGNKLKGKPETLLLIAIICFVIAALIAKTI